MTLRDTHCPFCGDYTGHYLPDYIEVVAGHTIGLLGLNHRTTVLLDLPVCGKHSWIVNKLRQYGAENVERFRLARSQSKLSIIAWCDVCGAAIDHHKESDMVMYNCDCDNALKRCMVLRLKHDAS